MARSTSHVNQARPHLRADPVAGVATNVNFAAGHFAAEVTAGIAVDVYFAIGHPRTDPVDS